MRGNAVVLSMLHGPAHRLVPARLTGLRYVGPVSGRTIRLPVETVGYDGALVAIAARPEQKHWWRAFRLPLPVRVTKAGRSYDAVGTLLAGPERAPALAAYLAEAPRAARVVDDHTPVVAFSPR